MQTCNRCVHCLGKGGKGVRRQGRHRQDSRWKACQGEKCCRDCRNPPDIRAGRQLDVTRAIAEMLPGPAGKQAHLMSAPQAEASLPGPQCPGRLQSGQELATDLSAACAGCSSRAVCSGWGAHVPGGHAGQADRSRQPLCGCKDQPCGCQPQVLSGSVVHRPPAPRSDKCFALSSTVVCIYRKLFRSGSWVRIGQLPPAVLLAPALQLSRAALGPGDLQIPVSALQDCQGLVCQTARRSILATILMLSWQPRQQLPGRPQQLLQSLLSALQRHLSRYHPAAHAYISDNGTPIALKLGGLEQPVNT